LRRVADFSKFELLANAASHQLVVPDPSFQPLEPAIPVHGKSIVSSVAVALAACLLAGCSFNLKPNIAPEQVETTVTPIEKRVLLLIPEEFAQYIYSSSPGDRSVTYQFGPPTARLLPELMSRAFTSLDKKSATGDGRTEMMLLLDAKAPDSTAYDFIAIPKFVATNSSESFGAYNISTTLRVEFVAVDKSRTISASGQGTAASHFYISSSLQGSGEEALRKALESMVRDIDSKRALF
jgi:hypothetical protein